MEHKVWVRVTRCQLLVNCLFILLLAVACCIMTVITGLGSQFTILTGASPSGSVVRDLHHTMVLYGSGVCALLLLTVLLSTLSVLRESQHLMAIAFIGFGFLFCTLMAGLTWTQVCESQVEASFLDVYDHLYEQVLRRSPGEVRDHLLLAHDIFQCCGKTGGHQKVSPTNSLCENAADQQVYGMVLSSFLFFSLPRGNVWDRRGEYSLSNALVCRSDAKPITPLIQLLPYRSAQ
ncbi:tetraspanin-32 isoform X2 [Pseudophryne corroboree]|uniref:tetraspanin-32 isoform X2 n=1 Tax=Pseudophryne corroboree TaxID=495146 RepID=UPI003081805C